MGMSAFYGDFNRAETEEESLRAIGKGLELGINFLDTAWIYQVNKDAYFPRPKLLYLVFWCRWRRKFYE
jgi:aryl-alcohol dehydrogenase-like predicted oxidoreductase